MESLSELVTRLKREIAAALVEGKDMPEGIRFEAERVILSLELRTKAQAKGVSSFSWAEPSGAEDGQTSGAQRLTIEFKVSPAGRGEALKAGSANAAVPARIEPARSAQTKAKLTKVFGPPGFDSSARATVFREAMLGKTNAEAIALMQACREARLPGSGTLPSHAHHVVARVLEGSPGGTTVAAETIRELLEELGLTAILRLLEDEWKSQDAWLGG